MVRGERLYRLDKVLQSQLDGEGGLADAAVAQHDELVEDHLSRHAGCQLGGGNRGRRGGGGGGRRMVRMVTV